MTVSTAADYTEKIPNNVGLHEDRRLQRALESWQPNFLSGLPPSRLQTYYTRHNWARLTRKMIYGSDWPGMPGIARNACAVAALCPDERTVRLVLAGNAAQVYRLKLAG